VVHKSQVVRILTFCLGKASPDSYSTYKMKYRVLLYYMYACVDCTLRIGFLDDDVLGCMIVTFHIIIRVLEVFTFID
jgi:hypothetical protein